MKISNKKIEKKNSAKTAFVYSTIGIQLALTLLIFVYGGYKLDLYYNSTPWFVLAGAIIGMTAGFYNLIKNIKEIERSAKRSKEDDDQKKRRL